VRVRANRPFARPDKVAAALRRLVPSLDEGVHALVLPVGANRVVAFDAAGSRGYLAELERFDEEAAAGDLLADPGLYFLQWLHEWSEWAARDHLKEPVLATTLKALQAIGRVQRWRDTDNVGRIDAICHYWRTLSKKPAARTRTSSGTVGSQASTCGAAGSWTCCWASADRCGRLAERPARGEDGETPSRRRTSERWPGR
jgi:hypothetical protein